MSPQEFWWFIEAKMERELYSGLSEDDADGLLELMKDKGVI